MSRIPLGYYVIAGLLFWGLPAAIVAGPLAILYTFAAVLPVWWICLRNSPAPVPLIRRISMRTCVLAAGFSLLYLALDSLFGRKLLQTNMFLFREAAVVKFVENLNAGTSKGGGVADLLGYIFALLPFGLIDATRNTSRYGRWILWATAFLLLFYQAGIGRGVVLMAVMAISFGMTSDWRRILIAVSLALAAFVLASAFRGDYQNSGSPLIQGIVWPFINLGLMLNGHCGSAPWYSFIAEFLKKPLPAFLIPKKVFSFNMEMSLCVYPSADNTVEAVSIFTWLGEVFYYKPSLLTAVLAGGLLGLLTRAVNSRLVENQMLSARIFAGLLCIVLLRSRSQDVFTFMIAQLIFLVFFWPHMCNLTRTLHKSLISKNPVSVQHEPGKRLS